MDQDFQDFYKKSVNDTKSTTLFIWIAILHAISSIIYLYIPDYDCSLPLFNNEYGFAELYLDTCETIIFIKILACGWLTLCFFRFLCLASPWQTDPAHLMSSIKTESPDGGHISVTTAAKFILVEHAPLHIFALSFLLLNKNTDLYTIGSIHVATIVAEALWAFAIPFRKKHKSISENFLPLEHVFTPKHLEKITQTYKEKRQTILTKTLRFLNHATFVIVLLIGCAITIQILRTPPVNPEYERLLFADQEPVWSNNLYFAIAGLTAPADVVNFYAYGLAKSDQSFKDFETLKSMAHIPYPYTIPTNLGPLPDIRHTDELKIKNEEWNDISCLYEIEADEPDCASRQDFLSYIHDNQVMWDRFNTIPDHRLYQRPPQFATTGEVEIINMAQLKAAHIIITAENGDTEKAFQDWVKYTKLYHSMGESRDSLFSKAIIMIMLNMNLSAFENLLFHHPEMAQIHEQDIQSALKPSTNVLFRADKMLSDDLGFIEPLLLPYTGNVNAIRNDLYDCVINFQDLANTPIHEYPNEDKDEICPLQKETRNNPLLYAIQQPGFFITNIIEALLVGGFFKGEELVLNAKIIDVKFRMALLGADILRQKIPATDIPEFIAHTPPDLKNPITQSAFEWDANGKYLYFIRPRTNEKVKFRLNLN